ncbi:hypothetical protein [Gilliamella sp. ESL0250]|uniref:hypothetical protein n=1 Tax=Gilliamella sp. ESL0250 TaxID=2705036 RepID=UPI00158029CD|nr:hypothetical protein [Gilliamella sp. ESL0250]NUF49863.1 hypothetical protein [Gilliamella sp. ESL0250]
MIHYHRFRDQQSYILKLLNKPIRQITTLILLISCKLLSKLFRKVPLALALLLLLPYSLNLQALSSKNGRGGNRSDSIIVPPSPFINFVRPNLVWGTRENAGPVDIWNPKKGFFVKSINPSSYELNFPTTGANGLYFDLDIEGVDARQLTWEPVTHEGITATVQWEIGEWDGWFDGPEDVLRVTITGPRLDDSEVDENGNYLDIGQKPTYPGLIYKPNLPQTFELVGKDSEGNGVVTYGFVLQKWFLVRDIWDIESAPTHAEWCDGLGYRLPKVKDLTNAVCRGYNSSQCRGAGAIGATPSSTGNHYQRQIGAGLFSEWGKMYYYIGAEFGGDDFPTTDSANGVPFFTVASFDGQIMKGYESTPLHPVIYDGLCVTP